MEFKYNSLSAKVYRSFYNTINMPQSLCPYFWKLIVAWPFTILFVPLLLPFWIIDKFNRADVEDMPFPAKCLIGALVYIALFFVFCVGVVVSSYWITYYQGTYMFHYYIGGIIVLCGVMISTSIWLCIKWNELIKQKKRQKRYDEDGNYLPYGGEPKKQNIFIEFIKAKYNKYCPKIDWK